MNRRKFISTCTCCAFASAGAVFLDKNIHLINSSEKITRIRIHIAEHCNLKCKCCNHFSCIAEKEFYNLDKFKQDMARMSFIFENKLKEVYLLGGEPLLNPQINRYVELTRNYFPNVNIFITTNATLLDSMDEAFWKTLNQNNAYITPSIYPVKINWASILDKSKKYNVKIYGCPIDKIELTMENINKFRKDVFAKTKLIENPPSSVERPKCKRKNECYCMYNGRLYPCAIIAYIRHLNKKFNTKFMVTKEDYLDLYKINNMSKVNEFINKPHYPFCKYCTNHGEEIKWENSSKHDLSEWV